jgi:hypothetical protein
MMLVSHRIFPPPHHQSQERISQTQRGYSHKGTRSLGRGNDHPSTPITTKNNIT